GPSAARLTWAAGGACRRLVPLEAECSLRERSSEGHATLAQSVERLTRNEQVRSSILLVGSASAPAVTTPSRCRVSLQHLAGDPASGVGGGEAGVAAGVVDDLSDLVLGQPVVAGDLDVELELFGGAQRDQDAERDKAALAPTQSFASPEPAEDVVDTDLEYSSPNLPSRRLTSSGTAPESNSRNIWRPCSRTSVMPSTVARLSVADSARCLSPRTTEVPRIQPDPRRYTPTKPPCSPAP